MEGRHEEGGETSNLMEEVDRLHHIRQSFVSAFKRRDRPGSEGMGGTGDGDGGNHSIVHGCSPYCRTIDPRSPAMPCRSTSGFHRPRQTLRAESASNPKKRELLIPSTKKNANTFRRQAAKPTHASLHPTHHPFHKATS